MAKHFKIKMMVTRNQGMGGRESWSTDTGFGICGIKRHCCAPMFSHTLLALSSDFSRKVSFSLITDTHAPRKCLDPLAG